MLYRKKEERKESRKTAKACMSAAMQGVPSSWPGFKELLLSNSISKTPFKTFRK